jgi:hypothetical protein
MKLFNGDDLVTMRLTGDTHSMLTLHVSPNPRPIVSYGAHHQPLFLCYTSVNDVALHIISKFYRKLGYTNLGDV